MFTVANAAEENFNLSCTEGEYSASLVNIYKEGINKKERGRIYYGNTVAEISCPKYVFYGLEKGYGFVCAGVWDYDLKWDDEKNKPSKTRIDTVVIVNIYKDKSNTSNVTGWKAKFTGPIMYGKTELILDCVLTAKLNTVPVAK